MGELFKVVGLAAGTAGIGLAVFLLLFKRIQLPKATRHHLTLFMWLVWSICVIAMAIHFFSGKEEPPASHRASVSSGEPEKYDEDWIPLVYSDIGHFRSFLERNDGKLVKINSAIALDMVVPVNHLVHQTCEMDLPDHAEKEPARDFYFVGLPTFSAEFDEDALGVATYNESTGELDFPPKILEKIRCLDTLRIELMDPKTLRWSYGGTGMQSLPLSGTFKITSRAFSGPAIEFTLRQVSETF